MQTSYRRIMAYNTAARTFLSFPREIYKKQIELCSTDSDGNIVRDVAGRFSYTKANQIKLDEFVETIIKRKNKWTFSLNRVIDQLGEKVDLRFQKEIEKLRITHAGENAEGFVIPADEKGNYLTKKDELIKLNDEIEERYNKADIEITPHISISFPDDLSESQLEAFCEFVISKEKVAEILMQREAALED